MMKLLFFHITFFLEMCLDCFVLAGSFYKDQFFVGCYSFLGCFVK